MIGRTDPTGNNRKGMSTRGKTKTGWNKSGKIRRIYGACPIGNLLEIGKSIPIRIRFQWICKIGLEFIPIGYTVSISICQSWIGLGSQFLKIGKSVQIAVLICIVRGIIKSKSLLPGIGQAISIAVKRSKIHRRRM